MSAVKSISRKRGSASKLTKSDSKHRVVDNFDPDLPNDLKGIMSALRQIREKTQKDGQKKNEETIYSVATEILSKIDELKSKIEKDRQSFAKALSKSSKECESCLKNEIAMFQDVYEKFCKERAAHLQVLKDTISNFEDKERLFMRYEQLRKKEKSVIPEKEKYCADKIANLEESLKKKNQNDKTFSILRKTLGSFLDNASDEDFLHDY